MSLPPIKGSLPGLPPAHKKSPTARDAWGDSRSRNLPSLSDSPPLLVGSASDVQRIAGGRLTPQSPSNGIHLPSLSLGSTPSPKSSDTSPQTSPSYSQSKRSSPFLRTPSGSPTSDQDAAMDSESEVIPKRSFKPIRPLAPLPSLPTKLDAVFEPRKEPPKAPMIKPKENLVVTDLDTMAVFTLEPTEPEALSEDTESTKVVRECTIHDVDENKRLPSIKPPEPAKSSLFGFTLA